MIEKYSTVKEVAEFLGLSIKTVYAWAETGKIPAYKFGHSLRFSLDEVRSFVASRRLSIEEPTRTAKKIFGKRLAVVDNLPDSGQETPR